MKNQTTLCPFENNVIIGEGEFAECVCDKCVENWEEIELLDLDEL